MCPKCGIRYSDWFALEDGRRFCWPCWNAAGQPDDYVPFAERREAGVELET
jgi:hypothetical protein